MQFLNSYITRIWNSSVPNRLAWAICVAVVIELLVWLISRRLRRAFAPALQRDLFLDAAERVRRRRIILGLPLLLVRAVLYGLGLIIILRYLGFNTNAEIVPLMICLLAVAAVASWRALHDAIAGYFINYDNLYAAGERVTIGEVSGTVLEVGLRHTQLQADDGTQIMIANDTIQHVVNHTRSGELDRRAGRP